MECNRPSAHQPPSLKRTGENHEHAVPGGQDWPLSAFYLPGHFAGYVFGELVEILGWSPALLVIVAGPPLIGVVLMSSYDYSRAQSDWEGDVR